MTGENPKGSPASGSRRDRYRAQTREEAKTVALSQLAASGPTGISVNAIAKAMGMTGPALYRYFASRDDLLTELIIDAYGDLAAALHRAIADAEAADPADSPDRTARLRAIAH